MKSIARLFGAFGTLADSVLALAGVIDVATAKLRMQLASETEPPVIAHNGEVLDNAAEGNGASAKRSKAKAGV